MYKSVGDDRVFFSISRYLDYMFIVFTNVFHTVNNLCLKTTNSENGPWAPKIMLNMLKHMRYISEPNIFHLPTDICEIISFTPSQVICWTSFEDVRKPLAQMTPRASLEGVFHSVFVE